MQRSKRNKPRLGHSYDRSSTKANGKIALADILRTFAEKVITHKLESIFYWADKDRVEVPLDLIPDSESQIYSHFMSRIMKLDPLFQNKLYFYLAKEQIDYRQVDRFLNGYITRYWPEVNSIVHRDQIKRNSPQKKQSLKISATSHSQDRYSWKQKVQDKSNFKRLK